MIRLSTVLLATVFAVFGFTSSASAQYDLDCYQLASWSDAQATYNSEIANDGWDWMHLDEDGDGAAWNVCTTAITAGRLGIDPLNSFAVARSLVDSGAARCNHSSRLFSGEGVLAAASAPLGGGFCPSAPTRISSFSWSMTSGSKRR